MQYTGLPFEKRDLDLIPSRASSAIQRLQSIALIRVINQWGSVQRGKETLGVFLFPSNYCPEPPAGEFRNTNAAASIYYPDPDYKAHGFSYKYAAACRK
jgi:hypothetical protein